ncbi:glycosyltransferase [Acidisoma silvae]|uniref:Glycosyltransferase n=1 Tax=Acidisoma silvae TaxID=2802396 RepID=A0A963YNT2_9PROT|nr:glycosyltransferase [Acidisoma silvae]MCB8873620.1 glycosyltransferase [Acidisoma silvae]
MRQPSRRHALRRDRLDLAWVAGHAPPPRAVAEDEARAVALANRLLDVEAESFALRAELGRRKQSGGAVFDIPRPDHGWPLAQTPDSDPAALGPFDRRPDDAVILEGQLGQGFMDRFGLAGDAPDFGAATAALAASPPILRLIPPTAEAVPDVSIIIPIYGQLHYTLNCLDSLLTHKAGYSAEILIIDDRSPDDSGRFLRGLPHIRYQRQAQNGGFIASCNAGGALARGRFILFLNNDTRVVPGWLDALLESFGLFPRAGLVGSKLFYPDGSLQEAGGIVARDGTCRNYGREDDPNRPQYCHARPVDYISGCAIALPRALWHDLGGFDTRYSPAYCEDVDLCLRIAASGQQVWLQSESRVIHYEGKTSGIDTRQGVKAYQTVNQRKLFLEWHAYLEQHRPRDEAPYFERERGVARRLLVIDATTPTPDQDAGSVQTLHAIGAAQALGYKTHFVTAHNWLFQAGYTSALQKRGVECAYAPFDLDIATYLERYGPLFDVILVYRMTVLGPILDDIRTHAPQALLLFHLADLHYLRVQRQAEMENSAEGFAEAAITRAQELALIAAADATITHSTAEAAIIEAALPGAPVTVWPLMLDHVGTATPFAARRDICFLGGYRHTPNVDAAVYFVEDILPLIRAEEPGIRCLIAGANVTREVGALAGEGVEILGQVPELSDLFDRSRVFVCPLRVGAGVKGKVLSALSHGLPIVSTGIGIEGSGLSPDTHLLQADTPQDFAQKVLRLYRNKAEWGRLSAAGQRIVQEEFSPAQGKRFLEAAITRGWAQRLGLPLERATA